MERTPSQTAPTTIPRAPTDRDTRPVPDQLTPDEQAVIQQMARHAKHVGVTLTGMGQTSATMPGVCNLLPAVRAERIVR